jgi:hypothetical protein
VVLVELEDRGVGSVWDIGQVPARNFDWLPFTPPPLVAFSSPSGPSIEPDKINNLALPIACILMLLVGGSFRMEVGKGLVYPCQTILDNV